jgi:type II secretory ATPase GspE/PulE/Tfp pilus assembly ATPase PilB-like protein
MLGAVSLMLFSSEFLPSVFSVPLWFVFFAADPTFPRGPGFYFDPIKIALVLFIYLIWVRTCFWVDRDANLYKLPRPTWNPVLLFCGLGGLLVVWLLPWFWLSFGVLLLLYLSPTLAYVSVRNEKAEEEDKVLTRRHLRVFFGRLFGLKPPPKPKQDQVHIRFIGKSEGDELDDPRLTRVEESKGYKGALAMVYDATCMRATDIHMEPTKEEMTVRFRIDGMLQPAPGFGRHTGDAVINIFKVLADLDITEKRKPQDGSFSASVDEQRRVDFRVATSGSVAGEKLVLRILDKEKNVLTLAQLGMREKMRDQIHDIVTQPHGLFIVCGPTGAGKSTTLYACLGEIDRYQMNVITLENPVEYHIDNVTQIEVNPKAGKTFATELRSILRQDPDVIYIGEIRDGETAEIACQAAQTGHMVFTTLHANDTVSALGRLIDLGVKPFLIGSSLSAVLGQRLVRVLCPHCKVRYKPNPDMLHKANLPVDKIKFFHRPPDPPEEPPEGEEAPEPCAYCGGTGYHGRTGVFEMLVITDRIRDLIRDNINLNAVKQEAVKNGMKYLQEDGLRDVIEGTTSIQELLRVCK